MRERKTKITKGTRGGREVEGTEKRRSLERIGARKHLLSRYHTGGGTLMIARRARKRKVKLERQDKTRTGYLPEKSRK